MKDETKEILNKLLEYFKESNINDFGYEEDKLISYEEAQILLDCINNLQEEKKDFKETNDYCFELKVYKSRNEKAIEYIKENSAFMNDDEWEVFNKKELLNILNGGDDNGTR